MQPAPKDIQGFIGSADPELLNRMFKAEISGNMKEYRKLRIQLLKDHRDYEREKQLKRRD